MKQCLVSWAEVLTYWPLGRRNAVGHFFGSLVGVGAGWLTTPKALTKRKCGLLVFFFLRTTLWTAALISPTWRSDTLDLFPSSTLEVSKVLRCCLSRIFGTWMTPFRGGNSSRNLEINEAGQPLPSWQELWERACKGPTFRPSTSL